MTVGAPGPTTAPVPGTTLVIHVETASPMRAAGSPPMNTVALPFITVPSWLGGGGPHGPPIGMCGGTCVKPALRTAAGLPPISTVDTQPRRIVAAYGAGVGVGTGPPGVGIITMCVHTPVALS